MDKYLSELAETLGETAMKHGQIIAVAESCTAGGLGYALTSVSGSSDWFDRGFITYSNSSKMEILGVKPETLEEFGAVSTETAGEMALGVLRFSHATCAVSITGIAGPGGGTPEKPVGTVCFGFVRREENSPFVRGNTTVCSFEGNREEVREASIRYAIHGLIKLIVEKPEEEKISADAVLLEEIGEA